MEIPQSPIKFFCEWCQFPMAYPFIKATARTHDMQSDYYYCSVQCAIEHGKYMSNTNADITFTLDDRDSHIKLLDEYDAEVRKDTNHSAVRRVRQAIQAKRRQRRASHKALRQMQQGEEA